MASFGANIHNRARLLLDHNRKHNPHQRNRRFEVNIKTSIQLAHLQRRGAREAIHDAGDVGQNVDAAAEGREAGFDDLGRCVRG